MDTKVQELKNKILETFRIFHNINLLECNNKKTQDLTEIKYFCGVYNKTENFLEFS